MRCFIWTILLLALAGLLSGCATPITDAQARATATVTGCWPYGVRQPPPTPTVAGVPTPTSAPPGGPATATTAPTLAIYPTCTPIPGTPTLTPVPTRVPTPIPASTPQVPAALGGPQEIGDPPGQVSPWGRFTRSPVLAFDPQQRAAVVAYIAYGGTADAYAGDVWVRVQQPGGTWGDLQSLNTAPVTSYYGGLGLTVTPDGVIHLAYGGGDPDGDDHFYLVESHDRGATWSMPVGLAGLRGRILSLSSDAAGGLHLLLVQPASAGETPVYATLPPGAARWQVTPPLQNLRVMTGELQVLPGADGTLRRYVLLSSRDGHDQSHVTLLWSADGVTWQQRAMELHRYYSAEQVVPVSLLVAPRGAGLIAAAWGQTPGPGHARSGAFAQLSTDGGATWSREEIIALHTPSGEIAFAGAPSATRGGFEPALGYDAATDLLLASWVEDDFAKRTPELRGSHIRTLVAARTLTPDGAWRSVVTPATVTTVQAPVLADWGERGALWGTADGRTHWLVTVDERNGQDRVSVRPLRPAALFDAGAS